MRILFVIQGEGRGHLTQALSLRQKLVGEGHEVVGVLVGKSPARRLPAFFLDKIGVPVYPFESPNFLPTAKNKQVNLAASIVYNLARLPKYLLSVRFINRMIRETEADVVVNFYELLTGFTYFLFRPKALMICIAHQYLFLHPDFKFPDENRLELAMLRFFTRLTAIGAAKKLALSFRKMREYGPEGLIVVPPLLRHEVLDIKSKQGEYLFGYLLNSGFSEAGTGRPRLPSLRWMSDSLFISWMIFYSFIICRAPKPMRQPPVLSRFARRCIWVNRS